MNTKLYTKVLALAKGLMEAAEKNNEPFFYRQYDQLKVLCEENEKGRKNHPVQWETLADFTEETEDAIRYYDKALELAEGISAHDYIASICCSKATMLRECGEREKALEAVLYAEEHALKEDDKELKEEIAALIEALQS